MRMKVYRYKVLISIVIVIMTMLMVFVACSEKKEIPVPENLSVDNNVLTWDAVSGATSYDVKVDDNVYVANENKYTLPISDYETHEIAVRANTYDGTGEYSDVIYYKRRQTKTTLPQLSAPRISMTSNRLMWNTILNNNGYKIYFNGKSYIAPKNSTYYDLELTADGRFEITMQTLGDGVSYATSNMSAAYLLVVTDLKAPLQSLPKVDISFNAQTRAIEWSNRYSAEVVSYEIYRDEESTPLAVIAADASKTKQSYVPMLSGGVVHYAMRLICENGLYAASEMDDGITFPIADRAPASLSVYPDEDLGAYRISWSSRNYADGYVVEIDGATYPATDSLAVTVPATLAAGRHIVRVRTRGDNVYYADSLYSAGVIFYTAENGVMSTSLDTPAAPLTSLEEGAVRLTLNAVDRAASYRLRFVTTDATYELIVNELELALTSEKVGSRDATSEEKGILSAIFASLNTGVKLSLTAIPDSALYSESLSSQEVMVTSNAEINPFNAPLRFRYEVGGFAWVAEGGADVVYELELDGEIHEMLNGDKLSLAEGAHVARIRRKGEYALWSQEISLRAPIDLDPPTDLKITSGILTYTASENANSYILYANGEVIGTVYPGETAVRLSSRIATDGEYVIYMQAAISGRALSAPSEEVLYEKTDGAYGTAVKPYLPQSERELLSLMTNHATSYFRLKAGTTYDFTSVEGASLSSMEFYGVLWGNGATLRVSLDSPLFSILNGATISDLTIEIAAPNYSIATGGILAAQAYETELSNLTIRLTGRSHLSGSATFGLLFYSADALRLDGMRLNCDFTVESDDSCDFAPIAYDLKGEVNDLSLTGNVILSGAVARYAGVGVVGDMTVSGYTPTADVTVRGRQSALSAGCTVIGTISATGLNTAASVTLSAPITFYYGVSMSAPVLSDSTVGGVALLNDTDHAARNATMYGVSESISSRMRNVTVSATMKAVVSDDVVAAGFVSELGEVDSSGSAFTGVIEILSQGDADVTAAGCAITTRAISHNLRSAGTIKAVGGSATLSMGAITAESALVLALDGHLILDGVSTAEAVGGAINVNTSLAASGGVEIHATDCANVTFGGVSAGTNREISLSDYRVYGSVEAEIARIAGVYYRQEYRPSLSALGLTVELAVDSPDFLLAGALLGANGALYLPENAAMEVALSGVGSGKVAGFSSDLRGVRLENLTVGGSLSLEGSGDIYGIAPEATDVNRVTSTLDLTARGGVRVYALFDTVSNATALTYKDAAVEIYSDHGIYNGIVKSTSSSGAIKNATLSNLTFSAQPLGGEASDLTLYGIIEQTSRIEGTRISGVSYTIGEYDEFTFAGLALDFAGNATDNNVCYTLTSDAKVSSIGGAFSEGRGAITSMVLGGESPLTLSSRGSTRLGGLCVDASALTVTGGSSYLDLTVDLGASDVASVGGLAATLEETRTFLLSDHPIVTTILRKGAGRASLGGVFGELNGMLRGVSAEVDITDPCTEDLVGGIAGKSTDISMRLACSLVKGRIDSPSRIGGLIAECSGGNVEQCASVISLPHGENAGGLFSDITGATIASCYSLSTFTTSGYGLFKNGANLSIDFVYFAGVAHAASIAGSVVNCSASRLYADVALNDLPIVISGALNSSYRSFAYGYEGGELGSEYVMDGVHYPYLELVGEPLGEIAATNSNLSHLAITGTQDLYSDLSLPRIYSPLALTISWVDDGGNLEIENGCATVIDNGSGILKGYLSGGVCVYRAPYDSSGFEPLSGSGTELDPYLITNIKYFPHIPEYDGVGVYFKVDIEAESVTNATLTAAFTSDTPFRGTIDFSGITFISPSIGANGIFGYMEGATVKGLVIREGNYTGTIIARSAVNATISDGEFGGSIQGNTTFIAESTNSTLSGLTLRLVCIRESDFTIAAVSTGGTVEEISLRVNVDTGADVASSLVGAASSVHFSKVQALYYVRSAGMLSLSLVREDDGSVYDSVFTMMDAKNCDGESEIAGLILSADGSTVTNSAALTLSDAVIYPLVKEGTATYNGVKVCTVAEYSAPSGVELFSPNAIAGALAAMTGYEEGALYTPLGFDLLLQEGEDTLDASFESDTTSIVLTEDIDLEDALYLYASQPFADLVSYTFVGSGAAIDGSVLHVAAATGSGTLTLTNAYGASLDISVTVSAPYYLPGDGSEEDPYLLSTFADFVKMSTHPDGGYFLLTQNISGSVTEPMRFNGILMGSDVTVTIELLSDVLYSSGGVTILGTEGHPISFVINKASVSAGSAIFTNYANDLMLENCSVTVNASEIAFDETGTYGVLFGELRGASMENVTFAFSPIEITAAGGTIGLVAGVADECIIRDLTVSGSVTLNATGDVTFGVFGSLSGGQATYRHYVDLENDIYEELPFVDGVTISLTYDLTGADLTVGGLAGESNILIVNADGTVNMTLVGNDILCGGVIGSLTGALSGCDILGSVSAEGVRADIGGLVGVTTGDIASSSANVTIEASVSGTAYAGGAVGSGNCTISDLTVTGDVSVHTDATQGIAALLELETKYPILAAAGGAVGYLYGGGLENATVTLVQAAASADYEGSLYVLAGGAAGYLRERVNVTVLAGGSVSATGGNAVFDESVAVYDEKE